jgi:predicted Rossmann-fold nucleotide-binding protein
VSIAAFLGGNQVLGVVPKALAKEDIIGKTIGEELQVSTRSDRINAMFDHADAFIALPGGLGTLEEIFHISSWAHLNIH